MVSVFNVKGVTLLEYNVAEGHYNSSTSGAHSQKGVGEFKVSWICPCCGTIITTLLIHCSNPPSRMPVNFFSHRPSGITEHTVPIKINAR